MQPVPLILNMAIVVSVNHLNVVKSQYDASPHAPNDVVYNISEHKHQANPLSPAGGQDSVSWS